MIQPGEKFPIEKLQGATGPISQGEAAYTIVYFYPKDDTPGCTIEANEFEKLKPVFDEKNIRILGVSVDDPESHQAFCDKFSLTFELATDKDGKLGSELGILNNGKHKRVTYVLDANGNVIFNYPEVKPAGHAKQILDDIVGIHTRSPAF